MMTVIGKLEDVQRFHGLPGYDTWWLSGRTPQPGEPYVTWPENKRWLEERIARGDTFGIATDPATLPPIIGGYEPDQPNGYFTTLELRLLRSRGIEPDLL